MKRNAIALALAVAFAGTAHAAVTEFIIYKQENFRGPSQTVKGEVNNLEGGFAREGSSLIVRGGNWEVCTQDHFRGNCYVLGPGEYPTLGPGLGDRIVAVRFVGNQKVATVDTRNWRDAKREARDDAREERRDESRADRHAGRADGAIDLYGRQDFRGRSLRLENNERDLARQDFDGRASSVIVHEGTWELCTEPGFGGRCQTYRPGQYRYLAGLDERVSSARQVR
jgi:hypothetical protein